MEVNAFLVNAFTASGSGGNPAGVVLNADNLSDQDKLKIARTVGFSETAFVSQDEEVDFALSFFTVTDEVDFCGHATVATFSTLYQQGLISEGRYIQRTKAGLLGVTVAFDGQIVMEQALPDYLGVIDYQTIAEMIGLDAELLASTRLPVEIISTGLPDIIVPVPFGYLDKIQVNNALLSDYCKQHNLVGIHAFELCDKDSGPTASCRNFAPLFGIPEESATGSANGALACYLTKHLADKLASPFSFEQGRAMGCVSRITVSVESNEQGIVKVCVGGFAREIGLQTVCL
ncbi:PhzF family phenazine biosynthesis protein [Bowmanella yangjiangensis]|uniref:PhzF family phenazine biosynthesis protein n=1 Tax=Bowmanella yangjiangensis TaxID=2811230 RepID=A0ABS3CXA7_9ALTE|nr:PhzF family phenazine biosynthesis protein [Bowmanella yangjiangensis]MBN7821159.1 PhzF family phenazine biosynthesis protein [Bowmanella yangjiangensis]